MEHLVGYVFEAVLEYPDSIIEERKGIVEAYSLEGAIAMFYKKYNILTKDVRALAHYIFEHKKNWFLMFDEKIGVTVKGYTEIDALEKALESLKIKQDKFNFYTIKESRGYFELPEPPNEISEKF